MSETKFTPGKWKISQYDESPEMIVVDNGKEVETVIAFAYDHHVPKEEQAANARLIAKAPELLEALETAVKDLCNYCPADMTKKEKRNCRLCTRIDQWKKLIAKARGDNE